MRSDLKLGDYYLNLVNNYFSYLFNILNVQSYFISLENNVL